MKLEYLKTMSNTTKKNRQLESKMRLLFILLLSILLSNFHTQAQNSFSSDNNRDFWIQTMLKIAHPVVQNLADSTLRINLPHDSIVDPFGERVMFANLESFSRTFSGISPWLELGVDSTEEGKLRETYIQMTLSALENSINPLNPDYMNFGSGNQPLVDAAFLSLGFLRSPNQIWSQLDEIAQNRFISELKKTRRVKPKESNWLLFASMVEIFLLETTGKCDMQRLKYGVDRFYTDFYKGDGLYGDGDSFHLDYYNSYVIHPMMTSILLHLKKHDLSQSKLLEKQIIRHSRYADLLERMISPEGTYPLIGRTITCRTGAMHALSHAALLDILPAHVRPGQIRSALTTVLKNQFSDSTNFDKQGWLQIGFNGNQPQLAESYVNVASLYHSTLIFLPLGLPKNHEFWTDPYMDWTGKKAWNGEEIRIDSPLKENSENPKIERILKKIYSIIPLEALILSAVTVSMLISFILGISYQKLLMKNKI